MSLHAAIVNCTIDVNSYAMLKITWGFKKEWGGCGSLKDIICFHFIYLESHNILREESCVLHFS